MNDGPLARLIVPLRRWWWVVLALVTAVAVATVLTMPSPQEQAQRASGPDAESFRATHLLIRNDEAPTQLSFDLINLLARQGDLTNRIQAAAGDEYSSTDVLAVQLTTDSATGTMSIISEQRTPDRAEELAGVYASELVSFIDDRVRSTAESDFDRTVRDIAAVEDRIDEIQDELAAVAEDDPDRGLLQAELDGLLNDFSELRSQERALGSQLQGAAPSFVTLEDAVAVPVTGEEGTVSALRLPGRLWVRLLLLSAAAFVVGVVLVFAIDFLDVRLRTRRQVEDAFGLPVLADVPRRSKSSIRSDPLPALSDPGGATAEVLRALRLSISLAPTWHLTSLARAGGDGAIGAKTPVQLEREPRSIVVTSPLTGDGKSTLVANLAVSLAEGGKRVLVVDCDFRRPAVGAILDIDPGPGLREMTQADERPLTDLASPTAAANVAMVRSGSQGVTPPWFMAQARRLVERCTAMADIVIFDTGPITLTNEAAALLPLVDTSLLVVRAGRPTPEQARGTIEQFTQVSAHISGIVLVGSDSKRKYGYGYYRSENEGKRFGIGRGREGGERYDAAPAVWPDDPTPARMATGSEEDPEPSRDESTRDDDAVRDGDAPRDVDHARDTPPAAGDDPEADAPVEGPVPDADPGDRALDEVNVGGREPDEDGRRG
ncbi:MAG: hypothetical protein JJT89_01050 [Nitriliruptoraceae bacterium]|nr:hypothetical protein [Nitriliruptoraceae bacterium]